MKNVCGLLLIAALAVPGSAELHVYVDLKGCQSVFPPCGEHTEFQSYAEVKSTAFGNPWPANMNLDHRIYLNDASIVENTSDSVVATGWYNVLSSWPSPGDCHRARIVANDQNSGSSQLCVYGPPSPELPPSPPPTTCHNCNGFTPEPLILDLNGDGIHTTSVTTAPVEFDLTGDGVLDRVGWTNPQTEEGILYFDHNRNRVIDGGGELFGDATVLPGGGLAKNGFQALAAYDLPANGGNGDGVISPADSVWGKLRVWVDRDHDARMTNDENYSLGSLHVVELSIRYVYLNEEHDYGLDGAGNWHTLQGAFIPRDAANRVTRAMHDVYFRLAPP